MSSRSGRVDGGLAAPAQPSVMAAGMKLILAVVGPALLQALIAFLVVRSSGGTQSWTGELAFGLAVFGIPATMIANHRLMTMDPTRPEMESLGLSMVASSILPVVLAGIYLIFMFLELRA